MDQVETDPHESDSDEAIDEATRDDGFHRLSLLWMYALSFSSFGAYLLYWVYRFAQARRDKTDYRFTALWWAVGSLTAPICCALLYDFTNQARRNRLALDHKLTNAFPAVLYALLSAMIFFTKLSELWFPSLFLLPLPFLWVQHEINLVSTSAESTPHHPTLTRIAQWTALLLGLPLVVLFIWSQDGPLLKARWMGFHGAGAHIPVGESNSRLTLPSDDWTLMQPDYFDDEGSDLVLVGPGAATWVVGNVWEEPNATLDTVVDMRRSVIMEEMNTRDCEEERFFVEDTDHAPASLAQYNVGSRFLEFGEFVVFTLDLEDRIVELVGFTSEPEIYGRELRDLVTSVRPMPNSLDGRREEAASDEAPLEKEPPQ